MARFGPKMAIYQLLFFGSSPNLHVASDYIWGHNFWPNQDLDPLNTSKWPSEPQFYERCSHIWPGMVVQRSFIKEDSFLYRLYNSYLRGSFISEQTLLTLQFAPFSSQFSVLSTQPKCFWSSKLPTPALLAPWIQQWSSFTLPPS